MAGRRILITGGLGSIGISTIWPLVERGDDIRVLDLDEPRTRAAGHEARYRVEIRWGDIRDADVVASAVEDRDIVVHLAGVLPPRANDQPLLAEEVNVGGMRALVAACRARPNPPRLLFASSFAVYGPTQHLAPPRHPDEPVCATDAYSRQKIAAERELRASGLDWSVLRFCDVPPLASRPPAPMMFDIPLDTRFESVHSSDAGLAVAGAVHSRAAWGRVLLVGGGPRCQVTYRDYLFALLDRLGIGPLPEDAFATAPHYSDWLDSAEPNRLWAYQRHDFRSIIEGQARGLRLQVALAHALPRAAREYLLRLSPYRSGASEHPSRPVSQSPQMVPAWREQ